MSWMLQPVALTRKSPLSVLAFWRRGTSNKMATEVAVTPTELTPASPVSPPLRQDPAEYFSAPILLKQTLGAGVTPRFLCRRLDARGAHPP